VCPKFVWSTVSSADAIEEPVKEVPQPSFGTSILSVKGHLGKVIYALSFSHFTCIDPSKQV
jgi:hypothetical protein